MLKIEYADVSQIYHNNNHTYINIYIYRICIKNIRKRFGKIDLFELLLKHLKCF